MSFTPTSEQWDIMEAAEDLAAEQRPNRRLKINAGAGAAKTTTMSLVSQRLQVTSLYLAFNKSMAEEAKNKFPQWVVKKTTHGLAYGVFGAKLSEKLRRPKGATSTSWGPGQRLPATSRSPAWNRTWGSPSRLPALARPSAIR